MSRGGWAAVLVVVVVALGGTARAADKAKAAEAFRAGTQHYDLGEYDQALAAFKEAYRNFEDPAILYNIAQCYRQRGDGAQAIRSYRMYLIKEPNAPNAEEVRGLIRSLEKQTPPAGPPTTEPKPAEPPSTLPPPAAESAPPAAIVVAPTPMPPPGRHDKPIYKRWWLWTTIGAVALVGA